MTGGQAPGEDAGSVPPKRKVSVRKADLARNPLVHEVHDNLSSAVIQITEDKALICLMKNFDRMKERNAFFVPLGILLTLLATMVTATTKDALGFSKETWTAVGFLSMVVTTVWLFRDLYRRLTGKRVDSHTIVEELKNNTANSPSGRE